MSIKISNAGLAGMMFALLLPAFATAQPRPAPTLPDTEAGKRVAGWIAAFNTGDDAAGFIVIVLGNYDPPAAGTVATAIRRILSGVTKASVDRPGS